MKRIGVLGGTFNPVHNGHLAIAEAVYEKMKLDKVLFVPSCIPPHKSRRNVLSPQHRLNMVKLAVKDYPHLEPSSVEIERKGKSYTIDTLQILKKNYSKGTKLFFILGEDSLLTLPQWKKFPELLNFAVFIGVRRNKIEQGRNDFLLGKKDKAPLSKEEKEKIKKIRIIEMPVLDISSAEIRRRIAQDKEVQFYIPQEVDNYIKKNKLYQK